jgi:hypothetical protein
MNHNPQDMAQQEEISQNTDSKSILPGLETVLEKPDEIPLMSQLSPGSALEVAYARADTLEQKVQVIVQAIEHFYPRTAPTVGGAPYRFLKARPSQELYEWKQKLDQLYEAQDNISAKRILIKAAQSCWLKLQEKFTEKEKNNVAAYEWGIWNRRQIALTSKSTPKTPSSGCCLIL